MAADELDAVDAAVDEQIEQMIENGLAAPYPTPGAGAAVQGLTRDMPELEFRNAVRDALDEELAHDERVIFFGEDVASVQGGVFAATKGLQEKHGSDRVFDTPISELAITGAAFGSAVCGLRPVIEIMFGDFLMLSMDSLVNQAAKFWYLSNEQG